MSALPIWPNAYPASQAKATLKSQVADFKVTELPLGLPSGEGEHIWLYIEKTGANTAWIAKRLAEHAGVKEMDVGYAGMKDRHAITRQWFSVYSPKNSPDFTALNDAEMTVLEQTRHNKKLRRGDLLGNKFEILLRDFVGDKAALEQNAQAIAKHGVPNYFGEQRFGHDGGNIEQGRAMLAREIRVRNPGKKSIYLSAVRSLIFNEVLAERINRGLWGQTLEGDVLEQEQATGPMWGRGHSKAQAQALELEQAVVQKYATLCEGLEFSGLSQERRALAAIPANFGWQWQEQGESVHLLLTFSLASGYYATSLIKELLIAEEPQREFA